MRINRHIITITDYQTINLPAKGAALSVALTRGSACEDFLDLWVYDYQQGKPTRLGIYIVGTGNPLPPELADQPDFASVPGCDKFVWPITPQGRHLGTVVTPKGDVWHVFEGKVRSDD